MDFGLGSQSTPSDEFKQCSPEYLVDLRTTWCGLSVKGTGGYPPVNKLGAVCGRGGFSRRQEPLTACHRYSAPREDIVDPGGVRIRRRGFRCAGGPVPAAGKARRSRGINTAKPNFPCKFAWYGAIEGSQVARDLGVSSRPLLCFAELLLEIAKTFDTQTHQPCDAACSG